jgi:hypothetical protein
MIQHPLSRCSMRINASNPSGSIIANYRGFANPIEIVVSIEMLRYIRKCMGFDFFMPYCTDRIKVGHVPK